LHQLLLRRFKAVAPAAEAIEGHVIPFLNALDFFFLEMVSCGFLRPPRPILEAGLRPNNRIKFFNVVILTLEAYSSSSGDCRRLVFTIFEPLELWLT
jgi:hypothetical protein